MSWMDNNKTIMSSDNIDDSYNNNNNNYKNNYNNQNNNYNNHEEDDDSSYECSYQSQESYSSSSSFNSERERRDFYNMETRDDSFLENMYHFVRECLSNQDLMSRLQPSQSSSSTSQKKQSSKQQQSVKNNMNSINNNINNKWNSLSSRFIKKSQYESKIVRKIVSLKELVLQNKFQILFIIISIIMMILRQSDIRNTIKEKKSKECLILSNQRPQDMIECLQRAMIEEQNKNIFHIIQVILRDYHQLFYITIILLALYTTVYNLSSMFTVKSQDDYHNEYKKIHQLNTEQKVKFSQLKNNFIQKSQVSNNVGGGYLGNGGYAGGYNSNNNYSASYVRNNQLNNKGQNSSSISIFGMSINYTMPFFNKEKRC